MSYLNDSGLGKRSQPKSYNNFNDEGKSTCKYPKRILIIFFYNFQSTKRETSSKAKKAKINFSLKIQNRLHSSAESQLAPPQAMEPSAITRRSLQSLWRWWSRKAIWTCSQSSSTAFTLFITEKTWLPEIWRGLARPLDLGCQPSSTSEKTIFWGLAESKPSCWRQPGS